MKLLSLLVGSALTTLTLGTAAMAQDAVNPATLTCAEFLAMDAGGMAKASEAVDMAGDAMAGDAMADDAMAGDAMAGDAMADDAMAGDAMADDAMAGDAMADDAMAGDAMAGDAMAGDTTARITAACTANPDAKVADALAM